MSLYKNNVLIAGKAPIIEYISKQPVSFQDTVDVSNYSNYNEIASELSNNIPLGELVTSLKQGGDYLSNEINLLRQEILQAETLEILRQEILQTENPIGTIRISVVNTNPTNYLGFGTWVAWGSGRVPVGVDMGNTNFSTVEKTGGAATHTLTIDQMPSHKHKPIQIENDTVPTRFQLIRDLSTSATARRQFEISETSGYYTLSTNYNASDSLGSSDLLAHQASDTTGSGLAHNNLKPYITCYMWKRTA